MKKLYTYDEIDYTIEGFINGGCELQAPLWQQAFEWFRDEKKLDNWIVPIHFIEKKVKGKEWAFCIEPTEYDEYSDFSETGFKIYEEARLECLKKLIEI